MIGTSQNRPIVVPSAAYDPTPYIATADAMAISKWLDDPMIVAMIASRYWNPSARVAKRLNPTTIAKPIKSGADTSRSWSKW